MVAAASTFRSRGPGSAVGWLDERRYLARQRTLAVSLGTAAGLWHRALSSRNRPSKSDFLALRASLEALYAQDLQNVRDGVYPRALLFQMPLGSYLRQLPSRAGEFFHVWRRQRRRDHADLPSDIDLDAYPKYYTRTFHWQSDGWLSARSAGVYDAGVEFLFGGTADVMRRMAIAPLVRAVASLRQPRILDVACGTGRFLGQLRLAVPDSRLYGLDLSPHYVQYASKLLGDAPGMSLLCENAEDMPLAKGTFDAVSCLFLFHELPKDVRRNVMREIHRVLAPGGTFVALDSAQLVDSPQFAVFLEEFPDLYHEPYYRSYLRDDLAEVMGECGFEVVARESAFLSRVVVGAKV